MVIYASKYGSTREYAEALAKRLGIPVARSDEADPGFLASQPFLVVGCPIYGFAVLPAMKRFIVANEAMLRRKPVAAFVVCGDTTWNPRVGEGGQKNIEKLTKLLPETPFVTAIFAGRISMADLDDRDRAMILAFYKRLGREPIGFDRMQLEAITPFAEEIAKLTPNLRRFPSGRTFSADRGKEGGA